MTPKIGPQRRKNLAQPSLLRCIAEDAAFPQPHGYSPEQVAGLVSAGLGPILHRLFAGASVASPTADLLLGADLTARLLTEQMSEATEEILRAAGTAASQIVLLKGMAAQRHYPQPHLRLMGDIDLLAAPAFYAPLQTLLRDLGYVQQSDLPPAFFETHHHAMPFFHPDKRVWVEVHRALFPTGWSCANDPCFAVDALLADSIPIDFRGVAARALSDETHLAYTCAHWAGSFSLSRGLLAIIDTIYLARQQSLDWDTLARNAPHGWACRALGLMLGFLDQHGAVTLDRTATALVDECLATLRGTSVRLLYWLLDTRLVQRRQSRLLTEPNVRIIWDGLLLPDRPPYVNLLSLPTALLFPPKRKDRFSPGLAAKRARSFLRGPTDS